MDIQTSQVIISALGIFSSAAAIKLTQLYFKDKKAKREGYHSDGKAFRRNLSKRLKDIEEKEEANSKEILRLSTENATLKAELKNLKGYNDRLIKKIEKHEKK